MSVRRVSALGVQKHLATETDPSRGLQASWSCGLLPQLSRRCFKQRSDVTLPPRLWLSLVTQTGAKSQCCLLLTVSLPGSGSLVGAQSPASLLLARLPCDLLTWGLIVSWALEDSQPCLTLPPSVTRWGLGVYGVPMSGEEYTQLLSALARPASQDSSPPSSPTPLSQAEGLSPYSPDANGQMASVPTGPCGTMASGV